MTSLALQCGCMKVFEVAAAQDVVDGFVDPGPPGRQVVSGLYRMLSVPLSPGPPTVGWSLANARIVYAIA